MFLKNMKTSRLHLKTVNILAILSLSSKNMLSLNFLLWFVCFLSSTMSSGLHVVLYLPFTNLAIYSFYFSLFCYHLLMVSVLPCMKDILTAILFAMVIKMLVLGTDASYLTNHVLGKPILFKRIKSLD